MPKTPPERLAAALRANLKRRKAAQANTGMAEDARNPTNAPLRPAEKAKPLPPAKG